MKKIFALTILILALFMTACGAEKSSPANDMNTICKAYLYGDEDALKRCGMTKNEYEEQFIASFSQGFTQNSGILLSENQMIRINDAVKNLFKRAKFEVSPVSEDGNNATVKITITTFNEFTEEYFRSKIPADAVVNTEEEQKELLTNILVIAINEMQPVKNSDMTVECQYDNSLGMWFPVEPEKFGERIAGKIFNV